MFKNNKTEKFMNILKKLQCLTCLYLIASINLDKIYGVNAQTACSNPNGRRGLCISIYDCPSLLGVLKKHNESPQVLQVTPEIRFIQESQCPMPIDGYGRPPFACCTADKSYNKAPETTTQTTTAPLIRNASPSNGLGNVLPEPPGCGHDPLDGKIYNGNDTVLDQYPWMVLLEYRSNNGKLVLDCGGSLINQRYVLTAAHCVKGEIETAVGPLSRIRLGEYDISMEIDCIGADCNQKVLELGFEEIITHPDYNPKISQTHDIALIRLSEDVEYNDFIRPVCLPLPATRQDIPIGALLTVAGWGRTTFSRKSNVKKQLLVPVNDPSACAEKFRTRNVNIVSSQICAGGEFAKDSCDGDSGGPLMRKAYKKRWYQEGVVSFGHRCGLEGWPGVYTRVADYVEWIQTALKP